MKQFRLDGYAALITGAGSGMGQATALLMAEAGAKHLFLCGRRESKLQETAAIIAAKNPSCQAHTLAGDVRDAGYRSLLAKSVAETSVQLDTLVNNAGIFHGNAAQDTSDDEWREIYEVNVAAPFALLRDLLPVLGRSKNASILNISSTLASKPIPNAAAYNSAKAALVQMTRSLALELGPRHIRVNCILPAIVDTPMYRGRYSDENEYRAGLNFAATLHPLGRIGKPEDIAYAALYLASPAAAWMTGVELAVDGGMLCT